VVSYQPGRPVRLIFEHKKFELHGSPAWTEQWRLVLREQGAEVVQRIGVGNEQSLDYVLSEESEHYPSPGMVHKAADLKIPLVGKEWVIQCLFNRKLLRTSLQDNFLAKRTEALE
jgi:hypothetical protein